jgi:hypothetical protein
VTGINETTRQKINEAIYRAIEAGSTINDVADAIEGIGTTTIGDLSMGSLFDEYRSEMIARTELMDAYNSSAIATYSDAGFDQVQAIDGDGDPECAERDGEIFSSDEADSIEDHPNGTLDWVPVISDGTEGKAVRPQSPNPPSSIVPVDTADVLDAIRNTPPAIHNIEAPIVNVLPADPDTHIVNVAAPDLAPLLDAVNALPGSLAQKPVLKTVHRDANNRISSVTETPVDPEPDNDPDDA